jgi:hypothetical protein
LELRLVVSNATTRANMSVDVDVGDAAARGRAKVEAGLASDNGPSMQRLPFPRFWPTGTVRRCQRSAGYQRTARPIVDLYQILD